MTGRARRATRPTPSKFRRPPGGGADFSSRRVCWGITRRPLRPALSRLAVARAVELGNPLGVGRGRRRDRRIRRESAGRNGKQRPTRASVWRCAALVGRRRNSSQRHTCSLSSHGLMMILRFSNPLGAHQTYRRPDKVGRVGFPPSRSDTVQEGRNSHRSAESVHGRVIAELGAGSEVRVEDNAPLGYCFR
jgi:hypothetical protein